MSDARTAETVMYDATCPNCGCEYETPDPDELKDENRLCPTCFDLWPGMTVEEMLR